jgi:hypothetical protein
MITRLRAFRLRLTRQTCGTNAHSGRHPSPRGRGVGGEVTRPKHASRNAVRSLPGLTALLLLSSRVGAQEPPPFPNDTTLWPNRVSRANSDPWIAKNHDRIRQMRPRLLVLNFSNPHDMAHVRKMTEALMAALAESSRYHGYKNKNAPVFLRYEVYKYVDLRDPGQTKNNSSRSPVKQNVAPPEMNFDYGALFKEKFAEAYGVRDPKQPTRYLRLDELVDRGYVQEVWFFSAATGDVRCLESIELKPVYDADFRPIPGRISEAGNGEDPDRKWTGRSLRINNLNPDRGIGCAMENLGHSLEGMANYDVIPYFTKYFREYAGLDLDKRYNLPFKSFYDLEYGKPGITYPDDHTAVITYQGKEYRLENYRAFGGNVHFPPNGRQHYDLKNDNPVLATIEDWRIASGPGGKDSVAPWTNAAIAAYRDRAPDCMGPWLIYWRQNMPGLDNRQKDDNGKPMKNWWPFLFY